MRNLLKDIFHVSIDDCVFGDYGGLLVQNTKTCAQLIADQPRMCYHEDNRQLCCASCADIRNSENSGITFQSILLGSAYRCK